MRRLLSSYKYKLASNYKQYVEARDEKRFMRFNQKRWSRDSDSKNIVLVEQHKMHSAHMAFTYFSNILAEIHDARIVAFKWGGSKNTKVKNIYRSFVDEIIEPGEQDVDPGEVEPILSEIKAGISTKKDIEDIVIDGLEVGDLVYDSYINLAYKATIDLEDPYFDVIMRKAISMVLFWRSYFKNNQVSSVIISHTVYLEKAMVGRVAVDEGIDSYCVSPERVHYLTKDKDRSHMEHHDFPERFRALPEEVQRKGIELAKERLERRFSGQVHGELLTTFIVEHSPFADKKTAISKIDSKNDSLKVLVATHSFTDSPHPYGKNNVFPDFYEWMDYLGQLSEETDYEWYIKPHYYKKEFNLEVLESLSAKYKRFHIMDVNTSHKEILELGIQAVLTVYGSVGCEYPLWGIPVVNACTDNPHRRYNFTHNPQTPEELREMVLNISDLKVEFDKNEIYEYYYMQFVRRPINWLFDNYYDFMNNLGGYFEQFNPVSYKIFLDSLSKKKDQAIYDRVKSFILSKEHLMEVDE